MDLVEQEEGGAEGKKRDREYDITAAAPLPETIQVTMLQAQRHAYILTITL
jgi:hypothetical protein